MNERPSINPELDLILERVVDVRPELVWRAWTEPEHLMPWFCPRPWKTIACEIDLRPGGRFSTTMQSPEGEQFPDLACYLEIVPGGRLVWTNALEPHYRPLRQESGPNCPLRFTAFVQIEAEGAGTRYTVSVLHADAASRKRHEEMGFHEGWSTALDQLVVYVKEIRSMQ